MSNFIPYCSRKNLVDLPAADQKFMEDALRLRDQLRERTTRWVTVLQHIARERPEMHWCAYSNARVTAFVQLRPGETFGDMENLYDWIGGEVRRLQTVYPGTSCPDPDPEDDVDCHWRTWTFKLGGVGLALNCSFGASTHCRVVEDPPVLQSVRQRRVVCDGGPL